MCGIAGVINLNYKLVDEKSIRRMIKVIKHRGPDDEGYFVDNNIGLGHCRLSIIDLSKAGHQPMADKDKSLWIVYNGEVYNFLEIRRELERIGYRFKSNSDAEVILYSYKEWGERCVDRFNGMWAFAIWDKKRKELFCSRDRFGIKPFYYFFDGKTFAFASEIKSLLELD
ncbi:MAG: asparagine synthetase B, partial [Thermotoga sp.]